MKLKNEIQDSGIQNFAVDHKSIFEALPGLYLILLPDLTIVAASDSYLKATLTKREEIVGKNLFTVFPDNPEELDSTGELNLGASLKYVLKLKKQHKMALQRYDVRQANGTFVKKYWQPLNRPLLNSSNEIVYIIHAAEDVTDLIVAEEERKKHEEENARILKDLSDLKYAIDQSSIVGITDQKGIILDANENFCKISGYERDELIGSSHFIINSGYHQKGYFKEMWRTISSGKVWKGEIKNRAKGGKEYWVDTTIVPFLNEMGKPYQYFAIRTEITDKKNAEEQLSRSNEQLLVANKELESFSYSVSHDLRAPLRAINGYTTILKEDYASVLDEEGNRILSVITNSAIVMGQLIDELLAFSRLGKQKLLKVELDVGPIVQLIVNELRDVYLGVEFRLSIDITAKLFADNTMIRLVIMNLISNAIKYSSKKEQPNIKVSCKTEKGKTVFTVQDNGAGFDMKYYNKLFGVFQRLHSNADFEGTGVGLAIVERVINKHGGKVWAESVLDQGSTFSFSLPNK